jgi:peroxiredoxin
MNMPRFARCVAVAGIGLLAAVAMAQEPATRPATTRPHTKPAAKVTEQAQPILATLAEAYGKLKSIELAGRVTLTVEDATQKRVHEAAFDSYYQAPNRFRHEIKDQPLLGCDGQKVYAYSQQRGGYVQADAPSGKLVFNRLPQEIAGILPTQNPSLALALASDPAAELKEMATEITAAEAQKIDGKPYLALSLIAGSRKTELTLLIDPQTHLVRRAVMDMKAVLQQQGRPDVKAAVYTVDYTTIKPDAAMKADLFAWALPEGAKELAAARRDGAAAEQDEHDESEALALVAQPATDFTLPDLAGNSVSLAKLKGSVVVLDFWASWCGPCVASLPRLDKIHQDYANKGLKIYAINLRESKKEVADFVAANNLTLPVLLDADGSVAKQYRVEGIPQTVIIGKDGLVKKVIVGFDPDADHEVRKFIDSLFPEATAAGSAGVQPKSNPERNPRP